MGGHSLRILIVEDDLEIGSLYKLVLVKAGFSVEGVPGGEAALDRIRKTAFDAMLSDVAMPGIDGLQLVRQTHELDPDLPVVLVTGHPTLESAVKAVELGAVRYLIKPVENKDLVEAMRTAVQMGKLAEARRQAAAIGEMTPLPHHQRRSPGSDFDAAVAKLWVAFQPIVHWGEKRVIGYEALARSEDEILGMPLALFDAAELLGRVQDLSRAIRVRIAAEMAHLPDKADIYVNLHIQDLLDDALYDKTTPLSKMSSRVVLELTERSRLEDINDLRERIGRLRALGFRIAFDDLGAGYAGLGSFAGVEPDIVKLDLILIRDVHREETKQKVVRNVVNLCREMGTTVIAEGVERKEERTTLLSLGCDLFQGFLFGRPDAEFLRPF